MKDNVGRRTVGYKIRVMYLENVRFKKNIFLKFHGLLLDAKL